MLKKLFVSLFLISALFQITGEFLNNEVLIFIFKPLLMPFLLLWYLCNTKKHRTRISIVIALVFSLLGDIFLLFVAQNEIFFLLGLGAFLIAQFSYIFTFNKDSKKGKLPKHFTLKAASIFTLYIGILFLNIHHNLNEFLIPVVVYATVVGLMGVTATFRYKSVSKISFNQVLLGAALFIISDTFIALNKFLYAGQLAFASVIIMSFYIIGQYFIVKGLLIKSK